MVQRYAFIYGGSLASQFGDNDIASSWKSTAESMVSTIKGIKNNGIISEGTRTLDCFIIVGSLCDRYHGCC